MEVSALGPLLRRGLLDDGDAEEVFSLLLPLLRADAGAIVQAELPTTHARPSAHARRSRRRSLRGERHLHL